MLATPRGAPDFVDAEGGLLAVDDLIVTHPFESRQSLMLQPMLSGAGIEGASHPFVGQTLASREKLGRFIDQSVKNSPSLAAVSWSTFKSKTGLAFNDSPQREDDLLVWGETEDELIWVLQLGHIARGESFQPADSFHSRSADRLRNSDDYRRVHDRFTQDITKGFRSGSALILALLVPNAIPDLTAMSREPGFDAFVGQFKEVGARLLRAVSRFVGEARTWAEQDAAFELALNLKRLGAEQENLRQVSEKLAIAEAITHDYLARLDRPLPPVAKLAAHFGLEVTRPNYLDRLSRFNSAIPRVLGTIAQRDLTEVDSLVGELINLKNEITALDSIPSSEREILVLEVLKLREVLLDFRAPLNEIKRAAREMQRHLESETATKESLSGRVFAQSSAEKVAQAGIQGVLSSAQVKAILDTLDDYHQKGGLDRLSRITKHHADRLKRIPGVMREVTSNPAQLARLRLVMERSARAASRHLISGVGP
jgi:Sec-independent protein translocase protein TatA